MMDVTLPQLGESVTEGTLGKWLKKPGESVAKYEPIAEVVTDKVTAEVPSDFDGTMAEIVVEEGQTVSVGTVICRIETADGDKRVGSANETKPANDDLQKQETVVRTAVNEASVNDAPAPSTGRPRYSPAVLKLADEYAVDLAKITGTGTGGRITRKDVLKFVESGSGAQTQSSSPAVSQPATAAPSSAARPPETTVAQNASGSATLADEIIEPSPVRKTIAKRMVESKQTSPHAWTVVEADVTSLASLRQRVKAEFKRKEGIDLTYLPFFIKAVAEAIKQYPMLNAAWIDEQIHMRKSVNISIAVATDDALVVPVIHNADRLSIAGLAHAVNDLAARARSGRLQMNDVQGGTFTVNNTGAFGSILSQPIINQPQSAILSVESIVKRPVVVNDAIAIRSMVNLCLSLDHRLLDGWISGQFLKAVKDRLQRFDDNTVIY